MLKNILQNSSGDAEGIPQRSSDPSSPDANDTWVLRSSSGGGIGAPMFRGATQFAAASSATYQLSYRTEQGITVRATLS